MNLAQFYRRHLASRSAAATCRSCRLRAAGRAPAAACRSCRSTGGTRPCRVEATATTQAEITAAWSRRRQAAEAAALAALASSPRRLRAFRRLLADAQHLVPIREEQAEELTIAWPVMRRAVLRIGEALADRGVDRRAPTTSSSSRATRRSRRSTAHRRRRASTWPPAGRSGRSRRASCPRRTSAA